MLILIEFNYDEYLPQAASLVLCKATRFLPEAAGSVTFSLLLFSLRRRRS